MDDATLTTTICELLGALEGDWAWKEDSPYTSSEIGVFYGQIGDTPDRAVGVRVYATTDIPLEHLSWRRVQLRHRGARDRPDGADELASATFAALQGLSRVGGISGANRMSMAPLGADQNGREERTDNYIIILDNPEAFS